MNNRHAYFLFKKGIFFLSLLFSLSINFAYSQSAVKRPTIPLDSLIRVKITSIDSTTFGRYIIYSFEHKVNRKKVNAFFWAAREDTIFGIGSAKVKLCRVIQIRDSKYGEDFTLRGHAFFQNAFFIDAGDSVMVRFEFSEYSKSPTLRLCTTH